MDANNYETMGQKPPRIVIQITNFHNIPSTPSKNQVKLNIYITSESTNLPPVVTKKEVLCSRHIQLYLASHTSHIHTKTGPCKEKTSSSLESICPSSPSSLEE